jgi:hypothetical protein
MTGQSSSAAVTATLCSQCVFKMAVSIQNPAKYQVRQEFDFFTRKEKLLLKFIANLFLL